MSTMVDLSKYKATDVFAKKITESTLKAVASFEQKFDFKRFLENENETNEEKNSAKVINADVIISKLNEKREELLQKLLIYKRFLNVDVIYDLNTTKLKLLYKIIKNLFNNSFLYVKGDKKILFVYDKEKEDFILYEKEMFTEKLENILEEYELLAKDIKEKRNGEMELVTKLAINVKRLYTNLKLHLKEVNTITIKTNLFAKKVTFKINEYDKEAILIKNKIKIFKPNRNILEKVPEEVKREIVADYRSLWDGGQKLDDVLNLIVYSRFVESRKNLQLNINAPSDWGKGFLMECLQELGIGLHIKQEEFRGNRPSGLNIDKVRNATVLLIDEFKNYNNYLFEINNRMQVEQKYGSIYTIDVFLRLFLNKQMSESFVGYVDEQIQNRAHIMKIKTHNLLKNSSVAKKHGRKVYKEVVKEYFYNFFTKKFDELIKMGEIEAEKFADAEANGILKRYKLKTKTTTELIVETIIEFLEDYKKYKELKANNEYELLEKRYTKKEKEIFERFIFYNEKNQKYIILKYEDTIIEILREKLAERDFRKVEYSKGELLDIFMNFLKADYKVVHVSELKTKKRALVIAEQAIFKYEEKKESEEETATESIQSVPQASVATDSTQKYNALDLVNANIAYTANILKDFKELNNDKNKILLLTTLNNVLSIASTLSNFIEIYNTNNIDTIITNYIKDKTELLKKLELYKNETYIQNKLQSAANASLPF